MQARTHAHTHARTHAHARAHTHARARTHTHARMRTHAHAYTRTHACTRTHARATCASTAAWEMILLFSGLVWHCASRKHSEKLFALWHCHAHWWHCSEGDCSGSTRAKTTVLGGEDCGLQLFEHSAAMDSVPLLIALQHTWNCSALFSTAENKTQAGLGLG